jgi:hypothetical protein
MDLQNGSSPSWRRGPEALETAGVAYDGSPHRVPTMLRDQTTTVTMSRNGDEPAR